jgi:hypothetical protein
VPQFFVPNDSANFFTALLLSTGHFEKARELLASKVLSAVGDSNVVGLNLPLICLVKAPQLAKF